MTSDILKFKKFRFNHGINLTVRRGIKQYDGFIRLVDTTTKRKMLNIPVIDVKYKRFSDITNDDIKVEHDPVCRTTNGLLKTMKKFYPTFDELEVCTLVYFEVLIYPEELEDGLDE